MWHLSQRTLSVIDYICDVHIKFNYLYRDGANYKNWGWEVFSNNEGITIAEVNNAIRDALIDEQWFYVDKWKLPDLHFEKWDNETDHLWHEFDCVEETDEAITMGDISEFLSTIISPVKP